MISILLTAWKEEKTVGKAVEQLLASAEGLDDGIELILVCPDKKTRIAAEKVVGDRGFREFIYIKDPGKGKPHALNIAKQKARGEILVLTDGDVHIAEGSLSRLLEPFSDKGVGGVTGRPVCANSRDTKWGYWGNLFMDAAHERRKETLGNGEFFPMSGYLLAMRNIDWEIPAGILDDVYLSYLLDEKGFEIRYVPEAIVYVKQPSTLDDWVKQKVRNMVGHENMDKYFKSPKKVRSLRIELRYVSYLFSYPKKPREVCWSLLQLPLRLYMWAKSWWVVSIRGRDAMDIWPRVESTK